MPGVGGEKNKAVLLEGAAFGSLRRGGKGHVAKRCAPFGRSSAEGAFHGMSVGHFDASLTTKTSRPQTARERGF
jgi:hypothetical protein